MVQNYENFTNQNTFDAVHKTKLLQRHGSTLDNRKNSNIFITQDKENIRMLNSIRRDNLNKNSLFKNESQRLVKTNQNFKAEQKRIRVVRKLASEKLNYRMRLNIKQAKLMGKLAAHKLSKDNFKYMLEKVKYSDSVAKLEIILGVKRPESQQKCTPDTITEQSANELDISTEFIKIHSEYNEIKKKDKETNAVNKVQNEISQPYQATKLNKKTSNKFIGLLVATKL